MLDNFLTVLQVITLHQRLKFNFSNMCELKVSN